MAGAIAWAGTVATSGAAGRWRSSREHESRVLAVTLWEICTSLGVPANAPGKVCGWHSLWVNGTQETEPSTRLHLSGTSLVTVFLAA